MYPIYFVFSVQILNSNLFSCNMVYFQHLFFLTHSYQALQNGTVSFSLTWWILQFLFLRIALVPLQIICYFIHVLVDENFDSVSQVGSTVWL